MKIPKCKNSITGKHYFEYEIIYANYSYYGTTSGGGGMTTNHLKCHYCGKYDDRKIKPLKK